MTLGLPRLRLQENKMKCFLFLLGACVIIIGLLGLLGNLLNLPVLMTFNGNTLKGHAPISELSALAFISIGLSITWLALYPNQQFRTPFRAFLHDCLYLLPGIVSGGMTILTVLETHWDMVKLVTWPNPVFLTTFNFMLMSACFYLLKHRYRSVFWMVYGLGVLVLLVFYASLFSLTGHLSQMPILYNSAQSIPTAIAFLLGSVALLVASLPFQGLLIPLYSRTHYIRVLGGLCLLVAIGILAQGIHFISQYQSMTDEVWPYGPEPVKELIVWFEFATILLAIAMTVLSLRALYFLDRSNQSEQRLAQQLSFTEVINNSLGEGVYALDQDGLITYMNPAAERLLQWRQEEVLGKFFHDLIHHKVQDEAAISGHPCPIMDVLNTGQACRGDDDAFIRKDGQSFPVTFTAAPIFSHGRVEGLVCAFNEITERKKAENDLKESEQRVVSTFKQAGVGMAHVGLNGDWLRVNPKFCEIVGYSESELLRTNFQSITYSEDLAADLSLLERLLNREIETYSLEKRYVRKDQSLIWVNLTVSSVLSSQGFPCYLISVVENIQERKKAQESLSCLTHELERRVEERTQELQVTNIKLLEEIQEREKIELTLAESERRFRAIFNQTFEFVGLLTPEGNMIEANESSLAFVGKNWAEVSNQPFWELECWAYCPEVQNRMKQAIGRAARGEFVRYEEHILSWEQMLRIVDFSLKPIRNESGHVILLIPEGRDITEMKQAQEALRESEERFRTMADSSPIMVWLSDENTLMIYVNKAALAFSGSTLEEIQGYGWRNKVHPEDLPNCMMVYLHAFDVHEPYTVEYRMRRYDGQYRWVMAQGSPRYMPDGKFSGFIGTSFDIQEQKDSFRRLQEAKDAAELATIQKSQVLSFVSHDFKNPLNSIIGFGDMLQSGLGGDLNSKQEKYVHNILVSARHLLQMVTDILDIARTESGKFMVEKEVFEVEPLVQDIFALMQLEAEKKKIVLRFEKQETLAGVVADPLHFRQILLNLVSNGIKYNREGGELLVRMFLSVDRRALYCEVLDTGIGIPQADLPHLFESFYRVKREGAPVEEGTGLGLNLVKRLVESHGGRVTVESHEGVGSLFSFSIPQPLLGEGQDGRFQFSTASPDNADAC